MTFQSIADTLPPPLSNTLMGAFHNFLTEIQNEFYYQSQNTYSQAPKGF